MSEAKKEEQFLTYKGKPLVRCKNTIYYGSMKDKYVIMMQIQESQKDETIGLDIAQKVTIQLLSTDLDLRARDRIIKKSEKSSLYDAMDLASVWLERALKDGIKKS